MTTYPLSEPATIYAEAAGGKASSSSDEVLSRGSLSDCADLLQTWPAEKRASVRIEVDDMEIRYGPDEIEELLKFLRDESSGLSNKDITEIADRDGA